MSGYNQAMARRTRRSRGIPVLLMLQKQALLGIVRNRSYIHDTTDIGLSLPVHEIYIVHAECEDETVTTNKSDFCIYIIFNTNKHTRRVQISAILRNLR